MNRKIKKDRFSFFCILPIFAFMAMLGFLTDPAWSQNGKDEPVKTPPFSEKLTFLTKAPTNFFIYAESVVFDEKLTKTAYVTAGDEGMRVVINEDIGKIYDHIAKGYPIMAPETGTIGYLADKDGEHYAVIGGTESPPFDGVCCLTFSPNGKYSAYIAQRDGSQCVVMNGHALRKFDMIDQQAGIVFSPDSNHAAFIGVLKDQQIVVYDGKRYPPFDNITEIRLSPASNDVAFIAVKDKEYYIVQGNSTSGPFDVAQSLVWSPDGKHLASVAIKQDRWLIIKDATAINAGKFNINTFFDQNTNSYRSATPRLTPPVFSPDSSRFAYVKTDGMRYRVLVDGKTGPAFDQVSQVRFSRDSARFSYIGASIDTTGQKAVVVLDGQAGPVYTQVDQPVFSPDFQHMAYRARKDDKWCVVKGQSAGNFFDKVGIPVFSPDFQHMAYRAKKDGRWCMVSDQSQGAWYAEVAPPFFSPDSRHMAFRAKKDGKFCIVKNGQEQKWYDEISHLDFSADSSRMAYRAKEGDEWLIVSDQQEGKHYPVIPPEISQPVSPPVFSPDGEHLIYAVHNSTSSPHETRLVVNGREGDKTFIYLDAPFIFPSQNRFYTLVGQVTGNEQISTYRLDVNIIN